MAERMTGGQAVVRSLAEHGVDVVFGIPGVHTLALYDALIDSPIRHILGRHEQGVGFMADGYARASGRPGVALVITGPGITNVATPLAEAYTNSSPVFVLSSNVERAYVDQMRDARQPSRFEGPIRRHVGHHGVERSSQFRRRRTDGRRRVLSPATHRSTATRP